jgi:hypothetical protein
MTNIAVVAIVFSCLVVCLCAAAIVADLEEIHNELQEARSKLEEMMRSKT